MTMAKHSSTAPGPQAATAAGPDPVQGGNNTRSGERRHRMPRWHNLTQVLRLRRPPGAASTRFWEIDALRGVSVVMMVIYHFMYDLFFFGYSRQVFDLPFWSGFQTATASLFILLAGVSTSLATRSRRLASLSFVQRWRDTSRRGGVILGWGFVLSLITFLALGPRRFIQFGILHLIGSSIIVSYPLLGRKKTSLFLGLGLFTVGTLLGTRTFSGWETRLTWLGFAPEGYEAVDYFPFIRWFGLFLVGTFIGATSFSRRQGALWRPDMATQAPFSWLRALGLRALPIYLLHQPVLFALFFVGEGLRLVWRAWG